MDRRSLTHYAVLFGGVALLVAAMLAGVTATGYAFSHELSTDDSSEIADEKWTHGVYEYEDLTSDERAYVDGALAGERYFFGINEPLPGPPLTSYADHLIVDHDGQYHVFTRGPGVDWTSTGGLAALALAASGLLLIVESIRRHHFPHYRPLGRFR